MDLLLNYKKTGFSSVSSPFLIPKALYSQQSGHYVNSRTMGSIGNFGLT